MSDGAAAVLIGRRSAVEARGLPVMGVLRAGAVVGVPPDVMGIGPAVVIPAALQKAGEGFLPFLAPLLLAAKFSPPSLEYNIFINPLL